MGLLELFENAKEVVSARDEMLKSSLDYDLAHDFAISYAKAFDEEHARKSRALLEDEEYARRLCDSERDESERMYKEDEELARRLQAECELISIASPARIVATGEDAIHPTGLEKTVEVFKRQGQARIGIELERTRREIVITAVRPSQPAEEANLVAGDAVLAVNGVSVTSAIRASQLIAASRDVVVLTIRVLPDAASICFQKHSEEAAREIDLAWDAKAKEVRIEKRASSEELE
ncbi:MAG: hypothetical protein SGPRY_001450, partial [Prymnesium sp.]